MSPLAFFGVSEVNNNRGFGPFNRQIVNTLAALIFSIAANPTKTHPVDFCALPTEHHCHRPRSSVKYLPKMGSLLLERN